MPDPYESHLPVLKALSTFLPMRRVLEFGAGDHSTSFFLSLPSLTELVSVETDDFWIQRIETDDTRHTVSTKRVSPEGFDFVFIDDGASEFEIVAQEAAQAYRVETIRYVLSRSAPVVAIHDAEVGPYRETIRELATDPTFICVAEPHTAICWPDGAKRNHELLEALK